MTLRKKSFCKPQYLPWQSSKPYLYRCSQVCYIHKAILLVHISNVHKCTMYKSLKYGITQITPSDLKTYYIHNECLPDAAQILRYLWYMEIMTPLKIISLEIHICLYKNIVQLLILNKHFCSCICLLSLIYPTRIYYIESCRVEALLDTQRNKR